MRFSAGPVDKIQDPEISHQPDSLFCNFLSAYLTKINRNNDNKPILEKQQKRFIPWVRWTVKAGVQACTVIILKTHALSE